jgi:hypothetical protein
MAPFFRWHAPAYSFQFCGNRAAEWHRESVVLADCQPLSMRDAKSPGRREVAGRVERVTVKSESAVTCNDDQTS